MRFSCRTFTLITIASAAIALSTPRLVTAAAFGQQEVDQSRIIAIAAPRSGGSAHQLLILEQISDTRPCWSESGSNPVIVDPLLVNFDFTGICGRSTDSNGYSLRVNGEDLGLQYSLRVEQKNNDLVLVAAPSNPSDRNTPAVEIGRAYGITPGFARLILNPGWRFTKRVLGDRVLGHIYLTYEGTFPPGSVATTPPTPPTSYAFGDIASDIYAKEIQQAVQIGFISGFEDNTFRPQQSLTREQLVSMVLEALKRKPGVAITLPTTASGNPYIDVEAGRWSAAKIQFAKTNNIVSGYEDGSFRPTQPVTRAEMMAVLRRAAEYSRAQQGLSPDLQPTQQPIVFSDTAGHWANALITQMSAYCGVASPLNEQGTAFAPNSPVLRNYAAAATLRMFNCGTSTSTPPAAPPSTSAPSPAAPSTPTPSSTPAPIIPTPIVPAPPSSP